MAGFRYRLQLLLDQKADRKTKAGEALAAALSELQSGRQRLEELRAAERECAARKEELRRRLLVPEPGQPLTGDSIRQRQAWLSSVARQAEEAKNEVFSQEIAIDECEEKVREARRFLADCAREVDVLTKHREKCERRFVREEERKEALEQEEIGARRRSL